MKTILFITVGILISVNSYAGVFKSKNDQGESVDVHVLSKPGKAATYDPNTGETKAVELKAKQQSKE